MSFTVHPATVADLPDIVTIYNEAFKNDRLVGMLMRNVPAEVKRAYDLEWYRREFNMSALNGLRFYKAMDGNGKMVGYAKWQYPHSLTSEQEEEKKKLDETKEETLPLPEGADGELYKEFLDPLHEKRRKHVQKENMYYLHILAIDPSYQRNGIGTLLLRQGLQDADRDGAKTYIEASPVGLQLYMRFGWKEIDKVTVDIGKIDQKGLASEVCLMREPNVGSAEAE